MRLIFQHSLKVLLYCLHSKDYTFSSWNTFGIKIILGGMINFFLYPEKSGYLKTIWLLSLLFSKKESNIRTEDNYKVTNLTLVWMYWV